MQLNRVKQDFEIQANSKQDEIAEAAASYFGDLCDSFIIVGYSRGDHEKFLWKINDSQNEDQGNFSEIDEPLFTWFASGK